MTITGLGTSVSLGELGQATRAGTAILEYVHARGIKTVPTLALMAATRRSYSLRWYSR